MFIYLFFIVYRMYFIKGFMLLDFMLGGFCMILSNIYIFENINKYIVFYLFYFKFNIYLIYCIFDRLVILC